MFNQVPKEIKSKEGGMAGQNLQPRISKSGKGAAITYIPDDQKIPVEIREIVRIKPQDFAAFKNSFEEWIKEWD